MRKALFIIIAVFSVTSVLFSARPLITEDAYLYSGFGLETGFEFAHVTGEEGSNVDYTLLGITATPIVGVQPVNIIATIPILYRMPSEDWIPNFEGGKFGIGDVTVGAKIGLLGTEGPLYLAIYPRVKVPTGKEEFGPNSDHPEYAPVDFGNGKTDFYTSIAATLHPVELVHFHTSFTYGALGVAGREEYEVNGETVEEDLIHSYQAGIAAEFGVHDKIGLIAELIAEKTSQEDTGWGVYSNTGVYFALIPFLNFDFTFNKGFTDYADDYGFGIGVSLGNLPRY